MQRLTNPLPIWLDSQGDLLYGGRIFVGVSGQDPESHPITVYWDAGLTIPAAQPLRTLGGAVVNGGDPAAVFIGADDYSVRVYDADSNLVSFVKTTTDINSLSYQPVNDDLTTISEQDNTEFGLGLLQLTNSAALKTAAGVVDGLPTTGGQVSGNITRTGAGPHLYHNDATLTSGRVFVTADGAADPTSNPGDFWITY